jgi:hypothetical protein
MTKKEKAEYLIKLLKPCLKKSRNPEWSTFRYKTSWGSKTEKGLKAVIMRVISGDELPKLED